jgi:Restriction endonuclease NotI
MSKVGELFGISTATKQNWKGIASNRNCPFLDRLCLKNRKSNPDTLIGTCSVKYGRDDQPIIICPHRLLERRQLFTDCMHLLTLHEPGNEFHIVPEVSIPGGSVDYFLVSVRNGNVKDFVGIELQTLDTTGTVWPERQRFLREVGVEVLDEDANCHDSFGMNWKMTAKTILVQLHHKVETFESIGRHLVLAVQKPLLDYVSANFNFSHIKDARTGDSMHIHSYDLIQNAQKEWRIELSSRLSTDAAGVSKSLGLQANAKVELATIVALLEEKISYATLFDFAHPRPVSDVTPTTPPS